MANTRTVPRVCQTCGGDFLANAWEVQRGRGLYCGNACKYGRHPAPVILSEDGLSAQIPLRSQKGVRAYVTVDAADVEWATQWRWGLSFYGYAIRNGEKADGSHTIIYLHRELLGMTQGDGLAGDHINRDRLDCRHSNLRTLPKDGNKQNVPSMAGASSAYRGVCWDKTRGKWRAEVHVKDGRRYLGRFDSEEEAAEVAREARARLLPFAVD